MNTINQDGGGWGRKSHERLNGGFKGKVKRLGSECAAGKSRKRISAQARPCDSQGGTHWGQINLPNKSVHNHAVRRG